MIFTSTKTNTMYRFILSGLLMSLLSLLSLSTFAKGLQPYLILAENASTTVEEVKQALNSSGFNVVGDYSPDGFDDRVIIAFTHLRLLNKLSDLGSEASYFSTWRIGILTNEDGSKTITSTNPTYWGNAYLQEGFDEVKPIINRLKHELINAIAIEKPVIAYGSEQDFDREDMREYHYMFGMPYLEDGVEIATFNSHKEALITIKRNLASGNHTEVYKTKIPGSQRVVFGVGLGGESGESLFVPIIDIAEVKHLGFLPYELLVDGNKVYMLHGRYRIALSFPNLTMGTFSKIMFTPGDIESAMKSLVE